MLYRLPVLKPSLILNSAISRKKSDLKNNEFFYGYSRNALTDAYKTIGLKKGDSILYPDFICDVTLESCEINGFNVIYYPIKKNMEPDWDAVEKLMKKGLKAILTINYFGFPQNLDKWRELVKKYNIFWIEDNAHGYGSKYKGIELGGWGDISVTSFRKTLPVLSGSILRINSSKIKNDKLNFNKKKRMKICKEELNRFLGFILRWFKIPYNKYRSIPEILISDNIESFKRPNEIDALSIFLLKSLKKDIDKISKKRRIIYKSWSDYCLKNDLSPIFEKLSDDVNPFVFPCYAKNHKEQYKWLKWGKKIGVEVYPWPNLPVEIYNKKGNSVEMMKRILCFPISHDMSVKNILKLKNFY